MTTDFYQLPGPSGDDWGDPPEHFSYSTLSKMKKCPLSYQLSVSKVGSYERLPERPNPATIYGNLVHKVLEKLFRELTSEGLPERGSPGFRKAMIRVSPIELIEHRRQRVLSHLAKHPRRHGIHIKKSTPELYQEVSALFQQQYGRARERRLEIPQLPRVSTASSEPSKRDWLKLLKRKGVLSEAKLVHPRLAFKGTVDTVYLDGEDIVIADFKTGSAYESHRDQLGVYALLWWRCTGVMPVRTEVIYFAQTQTFTFEQEELLHIESELDEDIARYASFLNQPPAPACVGETCSWCSARPYCDSYFETAAPKTEGFGDIQVQIHALRGPGGCVGHTPGGEDINVVIEKGSNVNTSELSPGLVLRVLNGGLVHGCGQSVSNVQA